MRRAAFQTHDGFSAKDLAALLQLAAFEPFTTYDWVEPASRDSAPHERVGPGSHCTLCDAPAEEGQRTVYVPMADEFLCLLCFEEFAAEHPDLDHLQRLHFLESLR